MYYEEQIIDGKLYYRITPKGVWFPVNYAKLLDRLVEAENKVAELESKIKIFGLKN
jgi:hypothetical protein